MNITANRHKFHYVYRITNLFPVGAERFYVGVRSCDCPPAKDDYWGSSKSLSEAINQQGQIDFAKEILSTWKTREEAVAEEIRLHAEIGVKDNPTYYNKANQTSTGFDSTGLLNSKESNKKRSETMKKFFQESSAAVQKKSETSKQQWKNQEFRKTRSEEMMKSWQDPEFRKTRVKQITDLGVMSRKTYLLTDPNGVNYSFVGGICDGGELKEFAKQNKMDAEMLNSICLGKKIPTEKSKYFGWTGSVVCP